MSCYTKLIVILSLATFFVLFQREFSNFNWSGVSLFTISFMAYKLVHCFLDIKMVLEITFLLPKFLYSSQFSDA